VSVLVALLQIYVLILFLSIVATWIPLRDGSPFLPAVRVLRALTDPVLNPLRRIIPPLTVGGVGLDLSPFILLLVLELVIARL
jgi:YggT family protein